MGPKDAGELRDRIRFERRATITDDGFGNYDGAWAAFITPRAAKLQPMRAAGAGGENVIASRLQGVSLWDCWIRYDAATATLGPQDRVIDARDSTRVFNIKFVQDMDGARAFLLLQLEAGVAT